MRIGAKITATTKATSRQGDRTDFLYHGE